MTEEGEESKTVAVPTVGQDGDKGHHMVPSQCKTHTCKLGNDIMMTTHNIGQDRPEPKKAAALSFSGMTAAAH